MSKQNIGILGGNGFLGSIITSSLGGISITRENYEKYRGSKFDTIINCVGNKYAYIAESNPLLDLESSLIFTYKTFSDFKFDKYIYLSSVAAYDNSIYGLHKRFCEDTIKYNFPKKHLILRPCNIININSKNIISDIFNEKEIGVTKESFMHFLDAKEFSLIMKKINNLNIINETINIGSKKAISPEEIGLIFKKNIYYKNNLIYKNYNMNTEYLSNFFGINNSEFYIRREFLKKEV
jgi:hypothetical protein